MSTSNVAQLRPATDQSIPDNLDAITAELHRWLEQDDRSHWEKGRLLAAARRLCENPNCGIDGPNPDARYGRWVSQNFCDTTTETLRVTRNLWEVFGEQRGEVQHIPVSALYLLAEPKSQPVREMVLRQFAQGQKPSVWAVKRAIQHALDRLAAKTPPPATPAATGQPDATPPPPPTSPPQPDQPQPEPAGASGPPMTDEERAFIANAPARIGQMIQEHIDRAAENERVAAALAEQFPVSLQTATAKRAAADVIELLQAVSKILERADPKPRFEHRWKEAADLAACITKQLETCQ